VFSKRDRAINHVQNYDSSVAFEIKTEKGNEIDMAMWLRMGTGSVSFEKPPSSNEKLEMLLLVMALLALQYDLFFVEIITKF
jgi:hypothetical protein